MNMRKWLEELRTSPVKKALPILSFPRVSLMNKTVRELIGSSDLQAEGMTLIARRTDSAAAVSLMDLSVEAECFGASVRFSDSEMPTVIGRLICDPDAAEALHQTETWGLRPRDIRKTIERKHIFTHIRWAMRGVYLEVSEPTGNFVWLTGAQIDQEAALPTAFRQFWEEAEKNV